MPYHQPHSKDNRYSSSVKHLCSAPHIDNHPKRGLIALSVTHAGCWERADYSFRARSVMLRLVHILKLGWSYRLSRSTRLSYPPYQFTIEPTNACNLRCSFCPQSDPDHFAFRPVGFLELENFQLFLDRVAESGTGNRNVNLTLDGEPFLNKEFPRMVELAIEAGFFPVFATNGILFNTENANRLISAGPFRASVDFASDSHVFETIRGKKGHFDQVSAYLTYLMEKSKRIRGVQLDIHDIAPFAGVDPKESLTRMRSFFPPDLPSRIRFDTRQFHNFCGHLDRAPVGDNYRICPYPWTQMAVTYSGDCVPCCRDTTGRSVLGNLFEQRVMTIWNGDPYRQFRRNLIDRRPDLNSACAKCDLPYSGGEPRWTLSYVFRSLLGR